MYRLPYMHGPAYLDHDVTVLKNFAAGEGKNLQLRMAAFNLFNHPLVSFNNQNTDNLTLGLPECDGRQGADPECSHLPGFRRRGYQGGQSPG